MAWSRRLRLLAASLLLAGSGLLLLLLRRRLDGEETGWTPLLPRGPCERDEDCSLNGACSAAGACACFAGWRGHNCQTLDLEPLPAVAAYGVAPNVTSWGGTIHRENASFYHLYVTEEAHGRGLASWASTSQIVHATAATPLGPFRKQSVVLGPAHSNPQVVADKKGRLFLFHIQGAGRAELVTADGPWGPWRAEPIPFACNNPAPAFAPNGTLFLACHNGPFTMYAAESPERGLRWRGPIPIMGPASDPHPNAPGNCEDPFLYFDRNGHFHVIAHCYHCYWYPLSKRPFSGGGGDCSANVTCSGHGFSRTGAAGSWTWVGGPDAPYGFTERRAGGAGLQAFSTRERPWGLMGGEHGDQVLALVNGVSRAAPEFVKYQPGRDWCYTSVQATRGAEAALLLQQ